MEPVMISDVFAGDLSAATLATIVVALTGRKS